ncbi:hypothetical protein ACF09C_11180 [Streptomyces sp. NPDC014870]|uniref:hypothetical protein n=1 Tax=Streptomyces sp. NPDC014870 TaxID=3364925 RepID=UPI0036FC2C92
MRARDRAETAEALERYRRTAVWWVRVGAVGLAVAVALGVVSAGEPDIHWASVSVPYPLGGGLFVLALGLGSLRLARRMRRVLDAGDWSAHAAVALPRGVLVLAGPEPGALLPRRVVAVKERYRHVEPGPDGVLWWCGDPLGDGVIAPPGGGELVWTRPLRGAWARRRAIGRAELRGLVDRPPPEGPKAAAARSLRYAPLAEAARRRALTGRRTYPWQHRRPEPDARAVPWWRVRGLREISGLSWTAGCLLLSVALLGVAQFEPEDAPMLRVAGLFVATGSLVNVARLLFSGRHAARALARAATAPVGVPKRYTALADPYGGGPVLVVFPPHAGPADAAEGMLSLLRSCAPQVPVGDAELHGWQEFTDGGQPVVVARVGGRMLWPAGPYVEAGTAEFAVLAERLGAAVPQDPAPASL